MGLRAGILLLLILSWGGAPAEAAPEAVALLTLTEAMLLALQHHPSLKAAGMTVETAEADLAKARPRVQEAATLKGYTVVRGPAAGVVAERRAAVGDLAQPGQTLLSLYNPEELQTEGEVNDAYRQAVKVGRPARLTVPAAAWQAELPLAEIFLISQAGSRTFKVRTGMIREHPGLVPGMFARLELPLGEPRGILILRAAVLRVGQLSMVQVVVDRAPRLRQVKLGRQLDHRVGVLAGLKPGDQMLFPE